MNSWWWLFAGLFLLAILIKFFRRFFFGLLVLLGLEIILIIIWPQVLIYLADLAMRVRELF